MAAVVADDVTNIAASNSVSNSYHTASLAACMRAHLLDIHQSGCWAFHQVGHAA